MKVNTFSNHLHLENLAKTCRKKGAVIDKDGKSRPWYKKIIQIFRMKQKTTYFAESCQLLQKAVEDQTITKLSLEDQFHILYRIEDIASKLSEKTPCDSEIQIFKEYVFNNSSKNLKNFSVTLMLRLKERIESRANFQAFLKDVSMLENIAKHFGETKDAESMIFLSNAFQLVFPLSNQKNIDTLYLPIKSVFIEQFRKLSESNPKENFRKYLEVFKIHWEQLDTLNQKYENTYQKKIDTQAESHLILTEQLIQNNTIAWNDVKEMLIPESLLLYTKEKNYPVYILKLKALLQEKEALEKFPKKLFDELAKMQSVIAITSNIKDLLDVMNKNKDNKEFINECLLQINNYLRQNIFGKQGFFSLPETQKNNLICYDKFFEICNTYLTNASEELQIDLKLLLTNLPQENRSNYPQVILTKSEQIDIIINKSKLGIESYINVILEQKKFSLQSRGSFIKLLGSTSPLREDLKKKLREKFAKNIDWNNVKSVEKVLDSKLTPSIKPTSYIRNLRRIIKVEQFFMKMKDKSQINHIPFWYHATKPENIKKIINSKQILVSHKRQFKGAWISSKSETETYGEWVFGFSKNIEKLDKKPFIGYVFADSTRWRGLQTAIPLNGRHLTFISIPNYPCKGERKDVKDWIKAQLKETGLEYVKVMSHEQRRYTEWYVQHALGAPNLTPEWWSKS